MQAVQLTRTHRILATVVVAGAVVIAAIGFAGSFSAVRDLAEKKGFGDFAPFFPIGIDAGIVVLLALDLLLTWIRIPFPLLRQTAWVLTAATIAFNGAAAWPDALGVGMHAVIPLLFVVTVEAARHAIGRVADITADKHMEGVRVSRWLLAFPSTFRLWRRMKLWELRSYDEVIRMEQDRLVYEARLRARFGRGWRRKAPVEALMPLKLARYGIPLSETGPSGLNAAGITVPEPAGSPRLSSAERDAAGGRPRTAPGGRTELWRSPLAADHSRPPEDEQRPELTSASAPEHPAPQPHEPEAPYAPPAGHPSTATAPADGSAPPAGQEAAAWDAEPASQVTVPVGPGRRRSLGTAGDAGNGTAPPAQSQQPPAQGPLEGHEQRAGHGAPDARADRGAPHTAASDGGGDHGGGDHGRGSPLQEQQELFLEPTPQAGPRTGTRIDGQRQSPPAPASPAGGQPPPEATAAHPDAAPDAQLARDAGTSAWPAPEEAWHQAPTETRQQVRPEAAPQARQAPQTPTPPQAPQTPQAPTQGQARAQSWAETEAEPDPLPDDEPVGIPDGVPREEVYFEAYRQFAAAHYGFPNARQLSRALHEGFGVTNADGSLLSERYLRDYIREFRDRYNTEMGLAG